MFRRVRRRAKSAEVVVSTKGIAESDFFPLRKIIPVPSSAAYLDGLNPEQRRAVEHGASGPGPFAPLLVIAGAGSGKTNTLAHRVAHLIVNGADPRRILMMTFSRRAASEMTKRVERIARKVMGDKAGVMAVPWRGQAPSTVSARGCCAITPTGSVSILSSRSTTARIPPT
jgi:primosomal protein N'